MSHDYRSTTTNPPLSPEERQRREMANAINTAMQQADQRHKEEILRIQQQHANDRNAMQQRLNALNSQFQNTIRQHQENLGQLRDEFDQELQATIDQQEEERQVLMDQLQDAFEKEEELQDSIDQLESNLEMEIDDIHDRIDDIQAETQQAINAVNQRVNDVRNETQQAIGAVNQSVNVLRTQTQQELQNQQQQINGIVAGIRNRHAQEAAIKQALQEAYKEQLSIVMAKNHQKYAPRRLQVIQAQQNGIDALPDVAAIAVLNQCFNSLLTLDADIEQAKAEYEAKHLITLRTVEEILARMHENRNVPLTDGNNNVIKDKKGKIAKIELDFWTDGEYGTLEQELETIRKGIIKGFNDLKYSSNDLDSALNRALAINQRQSELVIEAIERGNASQTRAEMADSIVEHLNGQTFRVVERGYENKDARKAYVVKLDDGYSQIVVIVNPQDGNNANEVVIGTVDTNLSQRELIQQGVEINEILREEIGINTQNERCAPINQQVNDALRAIYDRNVVEQGIPQNTRNQANL